MADNLFSIELVTPERILFTGTASEVILRTGEGDLSFLAGHTPLVGTIEPGVVVVVREEGDELRAAVHGGFVQVEQNVVPDESDSSDSGAGAGAGTGVGAGVAAGVAAAASGTRVTMLVGVAELVEEIDVDRARAALERAEAQVNELGGAGRGAGSGAGAGAGGEEAQPDAVLVEAEAALRRAQVRLGAVDAGSGVGSGLAG